eukprot:3916095-Rhodomonas_salina.1
MTNVQADITTHVLVFFRQFKGDVTSVTLCMIKEALSPKFEDWAAVYQDHKAFLKGEATRLAIHACDEVSGEGDSSHEFLGKMEAESKAKKLKTTAKKNTKAEQSSKRARVQQAASSYSEGAVSDDSASEDELNPKKQKKVEKSPQKTSKCLPGKKAKKESSSPPLAAGGLEDIAKKLKKNFFTFKKEQGLDLQMIKARWRRSVTRRESTIIGARVCRQKFAANKLIKGRDYAMVLTLQQERENEALQAGRAAALDWKVRSSSETGWREGMRDGETEELM